MARKKQVPLAVKNAIFEKLEALAKAGLTTTYGDLGREFGLDPSAAYYENSILWYILGDFSISEHEKGHPMISALVCRHDTCMPGLGFFKLAEILNPKLTLNTEEKRTEFYCKELKRLFKFWKDRERV